MATMLKFSIPPNPYTLVQHFFTNFYTISSAYQQESIYKSSEDATVRLTPRKRQIVNAFQHRFFFLTMHYISLLNSIKFHCKGEKKISCITRILACYRKIFHQFSKYFFFLVLLQFRFFFSCILLFCF